jgi:hypothetical protein
MRRVLILTALICAFETFAAAQQPDAPPQQLRITKGPTVESVKRDTATVAWSTNISSGTVLHYGADRDHRDQKAEMPWGGFTHRVTAKNLKPGTTYYFQAESNQAQGTGASAKSDIGSFTTTDH